MKALYLEWEDSASAAGDAWKSIETRHARVVQCRTVGFVIKENSRSITLAGHLTDCEDMSGDLTIPKTAITKRRVVSWKK